MLRINHDVKLSEAQVADIQKELSLIRESALTGKPFTRINRVSLPIAQEEQDNLFIKSLLDTIEKQKNKIAYLADEIDRLTLSERINKALKNIEKNRFDNK